MTTYCAFIRHSERADQVTTENIISESKVDPQITVNGIRIAKETGAFLKKELSQHQIDNIIIYSSPFLRTMQTAAIVAKELGI